MQALIVLTAFGIATGAVAKYKGSSFFIWFLIGFVLPLFGLIAAFASRSERDEPERRCPRCGTVVKLYVQVCPTCGEDLFLPDVEEVRKPAAIRAHRRAQAGEES